MFSSAMRSRKYSSRRKNYSISSLSLIFCDLDNFKGVNDDYGHVVGDKVLKYISSLIVNSLRSSDLVCRWGGEEFVIMLVGANVKDAYKIAESLRTSLFKAKILISKGKFLRMTASFGVSEIDGANDLEDLVLEADEAMYKAKKAGKNRVAKL
jgi:diguanylate cyclase (GGDEF)-like protein